MFRLRADESFYGDLLEELKKGVYKEREKYPSTLPDAYKLLMRTSRKIGYVPRRPGRSGYRAQNIGIGEGFMFAQHGKCGGRVGRVNDTDQLAVP